MKLPSLTSLVHAARVAVLYTLTAGCGCVHVERTKGDARGQKYVIAVYVVRKKYVVARVPVMENHRTGEC